MKKKILLSGVIILLFTANIYSQENHISFGLGALIPIDNIGVTAGPGLQMSWYNSKLFTSFMGLGVHAGVNVPMVFGDEGLKGIALVVSVITGPAFTVFDNGTFSIPITAGLHFDYINGLVTKANVINLGLGVVSDFEWRISQKLHAFFRLNMAVNFAGGFEFLLAPALGLGFNF